MATDWLLYREELLKRSKEASLAAYAPYSKFKVGSAVLTASGKIFSGCNVENASFGLTNCAERTAIFSAVCAGEREIAAICIYTPTPKGYFPCGACRQVISEFGKNSIVLSSSDSSEVVETSISILLPRTFTGEAL